VRPPAEAPGGEPGRANPPAPDLPVSRLGWRSWLGEIVLAEPRGEFTVALHIGQLTALSKVVVEASPADVATEFGHITETGTMTRRQAISFLARKYGLPSREVFAMLEQAKQSGV